MFNLNAKRCIYPDPNAWLSEVLINFLKEFHNEELLTLWDALTEYVSFHNPYCVYKGSKYTGLVELYPLLSYDHSKKRATLERLFFLSKPAKTIVTHDYLSVPKSSNNKTPFFNFLSKKTTEDIQDYPELDVMILHNNMEPSLAKEILLRTSHNRRSIKRLFVLENEAKGIEYKSINITTIDFDLSFLKRCSFLDAKRYESFAELLPASLIIPISCKLDYELPDIPKKLKSQQLLDVTSITT